MDVDDLTELVGSVTRKSAKTAWRLAAHAGVERCKRIKVEEEVARSARRRRMDKQSAEEDQAAVDKLNDTLSDVSRALAATRAELEVASGGRGEGGTEGLAQGEGCRGAEARAAGVDDGGTSPGRLARRLRRSDASRAGTRDSPP